MIIMEDRHNTARKLVDCRPGWGVYFVQAGTFAIISQCGSKLLWSDGTISPRDDDFNRMQVRRVVKLTVHTEE